MKLRRIKTVYGVGLEVGHEVPAGQMQYNADYKDTDQQDQCFLSLEGTVPNNVEILKYLGINITNDFKWNMHVGNICTKANSILGFLISNFAACPQEVKKLTYKGLVRPFLEYGSSVWDRKTYFFFKMNLRRCRKCS